MTRTSTTEALITLTGCMLLMMVNGSGYMTGAIAPYVAFYFQVEISRAQIILPIQVVGTTLIMPFGSHFVGKISAKKQSLIGGVCLVVCMLIASTLKPEPQNFMPFCLIYGTGFALVNGITYLVAVQNSWLTFPQKPALVSGLVISGFGIGSLMYTKMAQLIVNPNNLSISQDNVVQMHEQAVAVLPKMLRLMALTLGSTSVLATIMIKAKTAPAKSQLGVVDREYGNLSLKTILTSKQFLLLYVMAFSSVFIGYYTLNVYKMFGAEHSFALSDDGYLTMVGIAASVTGTVRFLWTALLDFNWIKFKHAYGFLLVMQIALGLTFVWAANQGRLTFMIWVALIMFCEGGHFTLEPYIYKQIFGDKMAVKAYGVGFSFTGMANMTILLLVTSLNSDDSADETSTLQSYIYGIYFGVGLSVFALLLLLLFFSEEPLISDNDDFLRAELQDHKKEVVSESEEAQSETEVDQTLRCN